MFTSSCLFVGGSCHIFVVCVCLPIEVSYTYCIVFQSPGVLSCRFLLIAIFDCPFGIL